MVAPIFFAQIGFGRLAQSAIWAYCGSDAVGSLSGS